MHQENTFPKKVQIYKLFFFVLFLALAISASGSNVHAIEENLQATQQTDDLPFPIKAPWPAGIKWHAGDDGSFYNDCDPAAGKLHCDGTNGSRDRYAIDFNGSGENEETKDDGVLVLAVADGIVRTAVNSSSGYGWNVVIGHAFGYQSRYAHLRDKPLVNPEQRVTQGTPLGYVGGSGGVGEHLHFAMYYCDPKLKFKECGEDNNRQSQIPEPLENITGINDGQQISSTNYGVGYEEMTVIDDVNQLRFHPSFVDAYQFYGGMFYLFGFSETPVQDWSGTSHKYQEFGLAQTQGLPWTGLKSAIFENNGKAYMVLGSIWEEYKNRGGPNSTLGLPTVDTYDWVLAGLKNQAYRNDFENGSIIWSPGGPVEILDNSNTTWQTKIFATQDFQEQSLQRYDKYIDLEWIPSLPPAVAYRDASHGASMIWEGDVGGLISAYRIFVTVQGNVEIDVEGNKVLSINSPDQVSSAVSTWQVGLGTEHVVVRFWQQIGKDAKINVTTKDLAIIPTAFASEGTIASSAIPSEPNIAYADYEPPPFPGSQLPPPIGPTNTATALVIDVSGSMDEPWQGGIKIDSAKSAANQIVNILEQETQAGRTTHRAALVTFTSNATLNLGLTADYGQVRSTISGLFPQSRTNIGAGLMFANNALAQATPDEEKIIILLSDGMTNEGLSPSQILAGPVQDAVNAGTCIYTVGFGDPGNLDENLLRQIASASGCGEYFYATDVNELERVYISIRHQSTGNVLAQLSGNVTQGQTVQAGTFDVPTFQEQMLITLHWPGSKLELVLKDPQGQVVDENYPGVDISVYANLVSMLVFQPVPGSWLVEVIGADVPQGTTSYDFVASARPSPPTPVPSPTPIPAPTALHPPTPEPASGFPIALVLLLFGGSGILLYVYTITLRRRRKEGTGLGIAGAPMLKVLSGPFAGQTIPMGSESISIGRGPANTIQIPDTSASRLHAIIREAQGHWFIQDQGSSYGTFVNDRQISAAELNHGDRIRLGTTEMIFQRGTK